MLHNFWFFIAPYQMACLKADREAEELASI